MDELTRAIQDEIPWCMLFADDIVLVDETRAGVNVKLELWRQTLESRGFRLSRAKIKYIECKFSKKGIRDYSIVRLNAQEIPMSSHFKYLGSIIQKDGEINSDVNHRIQAGWLKWRSTTGVLCDRNILLWLKGNLSDCYQASFVMWHRILDYKEISCPLDECSRDVHASLDMW